ncbi:MAG: demethoxyubiquinone hydroxylase family protein [Alphaproteobacteria bacterium]|nr:demethoxyubiquinone hydroxylase family protein [Alphaproteobacteria bacterium]
MDVQHLPGDLSIEEKLERLIRVNHAGEYGALRIYAGQLAVLKGTSCEDILQEMLDQEKVHFAYFDDEMKKRRVRPTLLSPLWHGLGFALGVVTARLGDKAAMACTVAVEDAIDDHYRAQEEMLEKIPQESELKEKITQFRVEEQEHKEIGLAHGAEQTPGYRLVYGAIKNASRAAIWLSSRL